MKAYKLIYVILSLFIFAPVVFAQDVDNEISIEDAMKVFCGTWLADGYAGTEKDIWNLDGTYELYTKKTDAVPHATGTFKIKKAWLDKEGNIWLKVFRSFIMGDIWILNKISNDGSVLEPCTYFVPENAPTKISDDRCMFSFRYIKKEN